MLISLENSFAWVTYLLTYLLSILISYLLTYLFSHIRSTLILTYFFIRSLAYFFRNVPTQNQLHTNSFNLHSTDCFSTRQAADKHHRCCNDFDEHSCFVGMRRLPEIQRHDWVLCGVRIEIEWRKRNWISEGQWDSEEPDDNRAKQI